MNTMNDNGVHTKLTDIAGELRGETEKAFRIYDGKTTEWVPKSQVEQNDDGTFTMPEWLAKDLAKDKGFIWPRVRCLFPHLGQAAAEARASSDEYWPQSVALQAEFTCPLVPI